MIIESIKISDKSDTKVLIICSFLCLAIFILDSLIPLGVAGGVPYILVVLVSLWSHRKQLPIIMAIVGSILTIVGFYSSPLGGVLWQVLVNRSLALFAIWVVVVLSVQRRNIYEEKEKILLEVKILSGLIPICASCKYVRDDEGYWNKMESYISAHSEAEFSHGICPDCTKKLYPEFDLYNDKENM
jgi:hypothetical protein